VEQMLALHPMLITKQTVAQKLAAYLHHKMTLAQLVDWAEHAMMEGEFAEADMAALRAVVPRLGVADVRAFGLAWEDCEQLLQKLGYAARVDVVAA
jgi:cobyrinic acid a,c-diamide synthase